MSLVYGFLGETANWDGYQKMGGFCILYNRASDNLNFIESSVLQEVFFPTRSYTIEISLTEIFSRTIEATEGPGKQCDHLHMGRNLLY